MDCELALITCKYIQEESKEQRCAQGDKQWWFMIDWWKLSQALHTGGELTESVWKGAVASCALKDPWLVGT